MANVRKLMRLAAEYEEHEGRDLRGFLDFAEERTCATSARAWPPSRSRDTTASG